MTEVVLEVIALGLQRIIVFIFNLPPCAARGNHCCNVDIVNRQGCGEGISIQYLTFFCAIGDFATVHEQCVIGIAQWHSTGVVRRNPRNF